MRRARRIAALTAAGAVIALGAAACTPPANPPIDSPGTIANVVPMAGTPSFTGPPPPVGGFGTQVTSVAQVGGLMVAGGSFTMVQGFGQLTPASQPFLAAWGAPDGAVSSAVPANSVNGEVDAIEPTPGRSGFYLGGHFTQAFGATTNVALYSLTLTKLITTFKPVIADGTINTMALVGTHLLLGGYFSRIDGVARQGLASVNAATGALEPFFRINLTGHHNFGKPGGTIDGQVGAISMSVSPDGSHVIVIGNFTKVTDSANFKTGYARDQIVNIRMTSPLATVDPNWSTPAFTNSCAGNAFDSYVQAVQWSPDGSFFVVVDSGGYLPASFQDCDSAVRFNASSTGLNVQPAWVDYTGRDSLYSVAVTSTAVYVGGHQRWLNNPLGADNARAGAVPRPGLAALDPANGVPLAWNPGRNPRGHGADVIYGTKTGIWVGSDTGCYGPADPGFCPGTGVTYKRDELAFFPYVGGTLPAGNAVGAGTKIIKAGSFSNPSVTTLSENAFNPATGVGGPIVATNSGLDGSTVRGTFTLNGRIYYGKSDGKFYYRTYRGGIFGPETLIDPYNDPTWDTVINGSLPTGATYLGAVTGFYAEIPNITGMFYANRSIYYTLAGDAHLYRRAFSPGTAASPVAGQDTGGVISPVRVTVVDPTHGGLQNFINAGGMWVAGAHLYLASRSGLLYVMNWNGSTVTSRGVRDVKATGTWSGRGVFVAQ
jgi:hypothetical protein